MPQNIYIIRHGETDYNAQGIAQGWQDIPLNKNGSAQAEALAKSFQNIHLDAIYSSDLQRAVDTALPMAKLKNLNLTKTFSLRERDMGILGGKSWDEIRQKYQHLLEKLNVADEDPDWNGLEGESFRQVSDRIKKFISHIKEAHKNQSVALVTHGGTKRNLLHNFGFPAEAKIIEIGNTSVTTLVKQVDKYILHNVNDTSHLR